MKQTNFHTILHVVIMPLVMMKNLFVLPFKMVLKYWAFQIMRVGNMTPILWRICV